MLPIEAFGRDASRDDGRNYRCRPCVMNRSRKWRDNHPAPLSSHTAKPRPARRPKAADDDPWSPGGHYKPHPHGEHWCGDCDTEFSGPDTLGTHRGLRHRVKAEGAAFTK